MELLARLEPCPTCGDESFQSLKERGEHLRTHPAGSSKLMTTYRKKQIEFYGVPERGTPERDAEKRRIAESIVPYVLEVMDTAKNYAYRYNADRLELFIEAVLDYLPQELADLPREQLSQEDLAFILSGFSAAEHSGFRQKMHNTDNIGKTWALLFMAKEYVDTAMSYFQIEKVPLTELQESEYDVGGESQ